MDILLLLDGEFPMPARVVVMFQEQKKGQDDVRKKNTVKTPEC